MRGEVSREGSLYLVDEKQKAFILVNETCHSMNAVWDNETQSLIRETEMSLKLGKVTSKVGLANGQQAVSSHGHAFKVEDDDHCETPQEAYEHITPILEKLAERSRISISQL